jgi:hypothetical protein
MRQLRLAPRMRAIAGAQASEPSHPQATAPSRLAMTHLASELDPRPCATAKHGSPALSSKIWRPSVEVWRFRCGPRVQDFSRTLIGSWPPAPLPVTESSMRIKGPA